MTVTTQSTKAVYSGDGATTSWPFSFPLLQAADMVVTVTDAFGNATVLASSAYTIPGQLPLWGGGNVVTNVAVAAGSKITLQRVMGYTQPTSLTAQSNFNPSILEQALDRIVLLTQQLSAAAAPFIVGSPSDTGQLTMPSPTARANGVLGFDGNGAFKIIASVIPQKISANASLVLPNCAYACDASVGPLTLTLPPLTNFQDGWYVEIEDSMNIAGTNNILVTASGADQINDHGTATGSHAINISNTITRYTKMNGAWRVIQYGS